MSQFTSSIVISEEYKGLAGSNLDITATHYTNFILLQLRLNGELDSTYEVTCRRLGSLAEGIRRPIAGNQPNGVSLQTSESVTGEDDMELMTDNMSDFDVITKLGDSNNIKLQVICTQIAELYCSVIVPILLKANPNCGRNMIIILSTKLATRGMDSNPEDFGRLVLLLQSIKKMYMR